MNSFGSRSTLKVSNKEYEFYRIDALDKQGISTKHLPFSLRILLENLLRTEDGRNVTKEEVRALAAWNKNSKPEKEIAFTPSRVLLQDFTGVPAVVDLAAMRDAMKRLGGDARLINPLQPAELVIIFGAAVGTALIGNPSQPLTPVRSYPAVVEMAQQLGAALPIYLSLMALSVVLIRMLVSARNGRGFAFGDMAAGDG